VKRLLFIVPVLVFAILAVVFYDRLMYGSPRAPLPSPLISKPAPDFPSMALDANAEAFSRADLATGRPTLVNFFASWCAPCRLEAPILKELSTRSDFAIYGVVYKDDPAKARRFLEEFGNPFARINSDPQGFAGIEWGITGVPETFVIDGRGVIRARHAGELTPRVVRDVILPALQAKDP
jgi:cytochrome c biogenesis protein CcmG/thiol:disulfide interchange protein DsbE